jgi:hypothetical protein
MATKKTAPKEAPVTITAFELVDIGNRWHVKTLYSDKTSRLDLAGEVDLQTPAARAAYIDNLTRESGIVF